MKLTPVSHGTYDLVEVAETAIDGAFWEALGTLIPSGNHLFVSMMNATNLGGAHLFDGLVERQRAEAKSLILIVPENLLDAFEEGAPVVPTLHEALDFLEMEDIERQLGF